MPQLSIIVVTHNSARTLRAALQSLLAQTGPVFELLIYDNASTDNSLAIAREFLAPPRVRVFQSWTNRGFSAGNNDAARLAQSDLLFFANPDLVLDEPDTLAKLTSAFTNDPTLGIAGFKLYAPGRQTLLHCGGTIGIPAHTGMRGRGERDNGQFDQPAEVDFVEASALALTRATWNKLHGFAEIFFPGYYEDTDLCIRARRAGLRVTYLPELSAIHDTVMRENSGDGPFWRMLQTNRILFTWRWLGPWKFITQALPAEYHWLMRPEMKYVRRGTLHAYARAIKRLFKKKLNRPIPPPKNFTELVP